MTYADSSFIVCLYSPDAHSHEAHRRMLQKPIVGLTPINRAELAHSLYQQVFRARIDAATAAIAWDAFEQDCQKGLWVMTEVPESVWERSIDLARRHGPKLGVRTLDSLHVACALELKARQFWTFDERQAKLAKAAGLDAARCGPAAAGTRRFGPGLKTGIQDRDSRPGLKRMAKKEASAQAEPRRSSERQRWPSVLTSGH